MTSNLNLPKQNKNKWMWLGLGAALLFCCGAALTAGLLFFQAGRKFQEGMKTDPEAAAQAAHEIVDYDLPPGYREQLAMDFILYSFVMIGPDSTEEENALLIMLAQFETVNVNAKEMEEQIRRSVEQQAGRRGMNMHLVETKDATIRGAQTTIVIYEGTDSTGDSIRQLVTSFPAKKGTAMLIIMGSIEQWDQRLVDEFIRSIR
ncbi:MAG TPA: hypothetical protein VNK49_11115 [Anaerolineales bacterium]|nr:hypothetical protein [Anaerolineales bacterium]